MAEEKEVKEAIEKKKDDTPKKKKSIFSRIWNGLIRLHGDDFEKRLQYISREEATILARMKKRSTRWRKTARNLIVFSVLLEVVGLGYAIMTTRSVNLEWKMRALRVLPIFLLPVLSWTLYSGLQTLTGMCDRRDQRNLERLRAERKEKIDELKERTNYYNTQELIQRYDSDPAAKAAAASVLASKLGADSGLQVFVGDDSLPNQHGIVTSSDVELVQSSGLRRRNPSEARSPGSIVQTPDKEALQYTTSEISDISLPGELVVEHHNTVAISPQDGGWIARLAALLVGEDPTQSYALICGNCHMHNGLARKEDFLVITYYCPHCHALNKPRNWDENSSGANSPSMTSSATHRLAQNKPRNLNGNSSGNNTPDKSSTMHHLALNTPRKSNENSSDINSPDVRLSKAHHHHALNKPRNSEELSSDTNIPDKKPSNSSATEMRSSTTYHRALNKSRNQDENYSDTNTPDMKSSTAAVVCSNLIKQSSKSMGKIALPNSTPVEESEKKVAEDPPTH